MVIHRGETSTSRCNRWSSLINTQCVEIVNSVSERLKSNLQPEESSPIADSKASPRLSRASIFLTQIIQVSEKRSTKQKHTFHQFFSDFRLRSLCYSLRHPVTHNLKTITITTLQQLICFSWLTPGEQVITINRDWSPFPNQIWAEKNMDFWFSLNNNSRCLCFTPK